MGKRTQRKKQLRAQRKRRAQRSITIHPASIPITSRHRSKRANLLAMPLEIRFMIISMLASSPHTITIAPGVSIYGPLAGLASSHPRLTGDVIAWLESYRESILHHSTFGDCDPTITSFKITFRSNDRSITRIYDPEEAQRKVLSLECWKHAMDRVGTNKQFEVNQKIRWLTKHLWTWKPEMARRYSKMRVYKDAQGQIELLLFDESLGPVSAYRTEDYEEPFWPAKPSPSDTPKLDRVYRRLHHSNHDLHDYYWSLNVRLGSFGDLDHLERAEVTWLLEDRALGRWRFEGCGLSAAVRESFIPNKSTPVCEDCDCDEPLSDLGALASLCFECWLERLRHDRHRRPFLPPEILLMSQVARFEVL